MSQPKKIESALISVFHKDRLAPIIEQLKSMGITIYSTGGTQRFIEEQGAEVVPVEELTSYPSILGGRVKTLHPKVFGGILSRRELDDDVAQLDEFDIPAIDLVIVDLYPFEETVASGVGEQDIIEKIDVGGISLIRAAAKNYKDVLIVSHRGQYKQLESLLAKQQGSSTLQDRKSFAREAFEVSSHYDTMIFNWFSKDEEEDTAFKASVKPAKILRYGENPHQKGVFYGQMEDVLEQLSGKELSYNNLLDVDAAVNLISDFNGTEGATFVVIKHNNACGLATRDTVSEAYKDALAGDPVSAFGGILITNKTIDLKTAEEINKLFYEVLIAPDFEPEALDLLSQKKKRVLLKLKGYKQPEKQFRSILNGVLEQDTDRVIDRKANFETKTNSTPTEEQLTDLEFANILVKHTKSNTIVLAKGKQLLASGTGQTSRVDALKQAIEKAKHFNFDLNGAVMASDAFFPFPDCVEIADNAGIKAVIQPGGSIKDQDSIDYCNANDMAMVFTGNRHFKH